MKVTKSVKTAIIKEAARRIQLQETDAHKLKIFQDKKVSKLLKQINNLRQKKV